MVTTKNEQGLPLTQIGNMLVTKVCAGTMTWGSFNDNENEAHLQLDELWNLGVNFYDTAELYPVAFNYGATTEIWIGNWLKKKIQDNTIKREEIFIATKCNQDGVGGVKKNHGYDSDTMLESCKMSLERLQLDYIDLYQIHYPCRNIPLFGYGSYQSLNKDRNMKYFDSGEPETFDRQVLAIKNLFDKGLIKNWGLSNETAYGITMFCIACERHGVPLPVTCQNDFSLNNRQFEGEVLEACLRFNIVGLPYGVLSGGTLTGKYFIEEYAHNEDRALEKCRHKSIPDFQPRYFSPKTIESSKKYMNIAKRAGITPAELAIAWANSQWYNGSVIIGTTTVRQVKENVNAFKISLSETVLKEIDEVHEEFRSPSISLNR